jgi:transcriptional regulator with XRE-family HTH domain
MTFGENIKRIRKEKGISQQDLGNKLGVTQQTVAQYEKIKETPKLETVRRIAGALRVHISELNPDWSSFSKEDYMNDWNEEIKKQYNEDTKRAILWYYESAEETEKDAIAKILASLRALNETGKLEAVKRVSELEEIRKYCSRPDFL